MLTFIKAFIKRIGDLLLKLISVKILIGIVASYLMYFDRLDPWVWFAVMLSIISARTFEKKVETMRFGK